MLMSMLYSIPPLVLSNWRCLKLYAVLTYLREVTLLVSDMAGSPKASEHETGDKGFTLLGCQRPTPHDSTRLSFGADETHCRRNGQYWAGHQERTHPSGAYSQLAGTQAELQPCRRLSDLWQEQHRHSPIGLHLQDSPPQLLPGPFGWHQDGWMKGVPPKGAVPSINPYWKNHRKGKNDLVRSTPLATSIGQDKVEITNFPLERKRCSAEVRMNLWHNGK